MRPDWIIFDVGGVLLDWRHSAASLADYLGTDTDHLLEQLFREAEAMGAGRISAVDGWSKILKRLGSEENAAEMILRWRAEEFWFSDTLKLAQELHDAGYHLAIFSNSWLGLSDAGTRPTFPPQISLFEHIFDSSSDGLLKPDPSYYELVQAKLHSAGNKIFFIDDDSRNLQPVERLGWQTFLYNSLDGAAPISNARLRLALLS